MVSFGTLDRHATQRQGAIDIKSFGHPCYNTRPIFEEHPDFHARRHNERPPSAKAPMAGREKAGWRNERAHFAFRTERKKSCQLPHRRRLSIQLAGNWTSWTRSWNECWRCRSKPPRENLGRRRTHLRLLPNHRPNPPFKQTSSRQVSNHTGPRKWILSWASLPARLPSMLQRRNLTPRARR